MESMAEWEESQTWGKQKVHAKPIQPKLKDHTYDCSTWSAMKCTCGFQKQKDDEYFSA